MMTTTRVISRALARTLKDVQIWDFLFKKWPFLSNRAGMSLPVLVGVLFLGACTGAVYREAVERTPTGSVFQRALYQSYLDLAAARYEQGDRGQADFYASRALQSGGGMVVTRLEPAVRGFEGETLNQMMKSASRLEAAFGLEARKKQPELAAQSQAAYDCWVHETALDGQSRVGKACREQWSSLMGELESALTPTPPASDAVAPAAEATRTAFTVYFGFDEWFLTANALGVIETAIETARQDGHSRILSEGHTDSVGPAAYNQSLSLRRAKVVRTTMVEMGALPDAVEVAGFGEEQPAVDRGDGVYEPLNRRTVITLVP